MKIPILIEPIANSGFRATGGLPFGVTVEGATRDEALGRLRAEINRRMASGAILVPLEIAPSKANPWIAGAGMFRDDAQYNEWQEAIQEYRRQVDQDAEVSGACKCWMRKPCRSSSFRWRAFSSPARGASS